MPSFGSHSVFRCIPVKRCSPTLHYSKTLLFYRGDTSNYSPTTVNTMSAKAVTALVVTLWLYIPLSSTSMLFPRSSSPTVNRTNLVGSVELPSIPQFSWSMVGKGFPVTNDLREGRLLPWDPSLRVRKGVDGTTVGFPERGERS